LVHTFTEECISDLIIDPDTSDLLAATYTLGVSRKIYRHALFASESTWTVDFTLPVGDVGSRTGPMEAGYYPDLGEDVIFLGLGNDSGGAFDDAKIYMYRPSTTTWSLNIDLNANPPLPVVSEPNPSVTAIINDGSNQRFYAATGDYTYNNSSGVRIYTFPTENPGGGG
jgi:hypothetical protein